MGLSESGAGPYLGREGGGGSRQKHIFTKKMLYNIKKPRKYFGDIKIRLTFVVFLK